MRFRCAPVCLLGVAVGMVSAQDAGRNKKDDPGQIGNRDVGKGVNLYSLEKEIALGKQLAEEVRRQAKVVEDPLISEYINRIGQNLVRNSDAKVPFTFQVIEGNSPNAFALPGGYVFVYTALIKIADEEDELAAAMAHEIAHVAARHMTRQATKSQIAGMAGWRRGSDSGGRTGRRGDPAGRQRGNSGGVPALHAQGRVGGRLPGRAVYVRGGLRPERRDQHFRETGVAGDGSSRGRWRGSFRRTRWTPRA